MFQEESFDSLSTLVNMHYPIDLAFLHVLSRKPQDVGRQAIFKGMLQRTAKAKNTDMTFDAWLELRKYLCDVEGVDSADRSYLNTIHDVTAKAVYLAEKVNPVRLLYHLKDRTRELLENFLMEEYTYNFAEHSGISVTEEKAREEAERQIPQYLVKLESLLVLEER